MNIFDESFWLAICFVIFVYLAYRPVRNALLKSLDSRISEIKSKVTEAEELKNEATSLLEKTQQEISKLSTLKETMLKKAEEEAEELAAERSKEIRLSLQRMQSDAEQSILAVKVKAREALREEFVQDATKLALEYFQNNQDSLDSDIEIAKLLLAKNK